jgi:hypothetical protein
MHKATFAGLLLALVGCGEPARAPQPQSAPVDVALPSASPAPSAAIASAKPIEAPSVSASPEVSGPPEPTTLQVPIQLAPGKTCMLVLHKDALRMVDRLTVEASADCVAQTLFDLDAERAADPQEKVIHEGLLPYRAELQADPATVSGSFTDVDFDGFVDIEMLRHQGSGAGDYNAVVACWTYNPKTHSFSRNTEYEKLPNPIPDAQKKIIKWGGRESGPYYIDGQSGFINGKLEVLEQTESILGQTPQGTPLSPGFQHWEIRKKRQSGVLVKVFEGPVKVP